MQLDLAANLAAAAPFKTFAAEITQVLQLKLAHIEQKIATLQKLHLFFQTRIQDGRFLDFRFEVT